MNRNAESRFSYNPTNIDIRRSRFDRNSSHKTSFNVGELIPFYVDEVLPGDSFDITTSKVIRLQTLLTPMMDNIYLDTYFFFVPNRLVWEHWKEFNGENTTSAWIQQPTYTVPQLTSPSSTGWSTGTIADYMGIPTGVAGLSVNALPFRAYSLVVNDWFRDENLQDPVNFSVGDATVAGVNTGNYITDIAKGGLPFVANKFHDYFTSALPAPQKGPDTILPLAGMTDVVLGDEHRSHLFVDSSSPVSLKLCNSAGSSLNNYNSGDYPRALGVSNSFAINYNVVGNVVGSNATVSDSTVVPSNLYADLSGVTMFSINQLRLAFQIQKLYEKDARGGTRYIEILKSHFGVTSPDYRLQRPEYLGGNRIPININQIIQQSESSASSPMGNTAAFSVTSDIHSDVHKSFTEHGFILGLCVARYDHTYQQGIEKMWSRKTRFDYYWPVFANIGEQPILNKEIYAQGSSAVDSSGDPYDDQVFGYQEAWADYRYKPSRVSGEMRSSATTSLDVWHLADDYSGLPSLSDSWMIEDKTNVDRVLAVTSSVSDQLFMDVYVKNRTTRPMPLYSIPGLIDHH